MRIISLPAFLGLMTLLIISCEYEPEGKYYNTSGRHPSPPDIQVIDLSIIRYDSIVIYSDLPVDFSFQVGGHYSIYAVRLLIDGVEKGLIYNSTGSFHVLHDELTVGEHQLDLEIYTSSGSGSIADVLGMEIYDLSSSWRLIVKNRSYGSLTSSLQDGLMHLSWTRYKENDFVRYSVTRIDSLTWGTQFDFLTDTTLTDRFYLGESAEYIVDVEKTDNTIYHWAYLKVKKDLPSLSLKTDTLNNYTVTWEKPHYYSAFNIYELYQDNGAGGFNLVKITNDINDTVFVLTDDVFGDKINLKLRLVASPYNFLYTPDTYYNFEVEKSGVLGYGFPCKAPIREIYRINSDEVVFASSYDSIMKFSLSERSYTAKAGLNDILNYGSFSALQASPSGSTLSVRLGTGGMFAIGPSSRFTGYKVKGEQAITGAVTWGPVPVSDAGTMLLTNGSDKLFLYDIASSSAIGTLSKSSLYPLNRSNTLISSQGNYILMNYDSLKLMRFQDNNFQNIAVQARNGDMGFLDFDAADPELLVIWDRSNITVKNCSDFSTVRQFGMSKSLINIDYRNGQMLAFEAGHLYVINYQDGSQLYDIPVSYGFNPASCFLAHHIIIYSEGQPNGGLLYFLR